MIRINLLPVRASRKHDTAKHELLALVAVALVVFVGLYAFDSSMESKRAEAQKRIRVVSQEIEQLKQDVVRVKDFREKAAVLEKKLKAIEALEKQKTGPAKMLDDLATILTDEKKVWLTGITERNGTLTLEGAAMEHENISDFQIALDQRSKFFTNVKLVFVKVKKTPSSSYFEWKIVCNTNYAAG